MKNNDFNQAYYKLYDKIFRSILKNKFLILFNSLIVRVCKNYEFNINIKTVIFFCLLKL